nr:immunoglobulin heavy chain junction region [Macaca mulatta]MOW20005.1 immunoglobulin heavy chain junction region [Macaca mulatta]MOW21220.1 immunoglobulin heavy chain junction region [Macaca mulatta]MOW21471.1 immunoglobulin heavy chain junction region [Macaca mulatta]
CASKDWGYW